MLGVFLFIFAINIDTFAIMLSYGIRRVKVSIFCNLIITLITTTALLLSLLLSNIINDFIDVFVLNIVGAVLLILMGIYFILLDLFKFVLSRHNNIKFFTLNIGDIDVCIIAAKSQDNKTCDNKMSIKQSLDISGILSIDAIIAGLAYGTNNVNFWYFVIIGLGITFVFASFGALLGRLIKIKNLDLSWLSGLILIILAIFKLL